jgi:hypothetical protein
MDRKVSVVLALMITSLFPAASIYAWQNRTPSYTEEGTIDIALEYLKNSPTFKFDGILDSINVTGAFRARTPIPTWVVSIGFECSHSGYGDRTGQILLQLITPYTIAVTVVEGRVTEATIDGQWDEMAQELLDDDEPYTKDEAVDIALDFVMNSPTFLFDGIVDSVETVSVEPLRMLWTWEVTVRFQCSHAGYGDRTGMMLAQVITTHEIRVGVSEGEVIRATVDETWDELNQREVVKSELLPPEYAKDLAIQYIIDNYLELDLELPEAWAFEVLTPEGLVGASTHQFTGGNWEVNVSYAVVMRPDYTVSIRYTGDAGFTWEGTVNQSSNVEETTTSLRPRILSQEDARDIVVSYLIDGFEQLKGLEAPSEWVVEDLTPEGLLGYSSLEFRAEGWTVKVSNPVVWKPTYEVEVEYSGVFALTWKGAVDQSGSVEETTTG